MRRSIVVVVVAVAVLLSCHASHSSLKDDSSDSAVVHVDPRPVAKALHELFKTGFILKREPDADSSQNLLTIESQEGSVRINFDAVSALSIASKQTLNELMVFPVVAGSQLSQDSSLETDREYLARYLVMIAEADYRYQEERALFIPDPVLELNDSNYQNALSSIKEHQEACKAEQTQVVTIERSGESFKIDCRPFLQDNLVEPITPMERALAYLYTEQHGGGEGNFLVANELLRSPALQQEEMEIAAVRFGALMSLGLMSATNKFITSDDAPTLFRGVKRLYPSCLANGGPLPSRQGSANADYAKQICQYYDANNIYRDCGFMSTSKNREVAEGFTRDLHFPQDEPGVLYEIKGSKGFPLSAFSAIPAEDEVILMPGQHFQVGAMAIIVDEEELATCDQIDTLDDDKIVNVKITIQPDTTDRDL